MTKEEFRKSKDYAESMQKIENYYKGFTFTLKYGEIPKAKANALKILTQDAIDRGILECISIGLSINGDVVEEKYRRL